MAHTIRSFTNDKRHDQQLVYVALSRATSLHGLFLTNNDENHRFHHARGRCNAELRTEFMRLERHRLTTIGEKTREYLKRADIIPTALSHCTLNTQILRSHGGHIATDHTLTKTKIMALTETWLKNKERADIPGYRPVAQWNEIR